MADTIRFDLVSPEKLLLSENVDMVTVPGTEGYMGVLAGHAPVISTLKPGVIEVNGAPGGNQKFFVQGGFVEINPAQITVLAEEAIPMAHLDLAALDQKIKNAEEDVQIATSDFERARAAEALDGLKQLRAAL